MGPVKLGMIVVAAALALWSFKPAHAAAIFAFSETGGDVVGVLSGRIRTDDLTAVDGPTLRTAFGVNAFFSQLVAGETRQPDFVLYAWLTAPTSFGPGVHGGPNVPPSFASASESTGLDLTVRNDQGRPGLFLPRDYVSNAAMVGGMTFRGQTFASIGVTPGEYVYTLMNGDTMTLRFSSATPVPLPAAAWLLLSGLASLVLLRGRRAGR